MADLTCSQNLYCLNRKNRTIEENNHIIIQNDINFFFLNLQKENKVEINKGVVLFAKELIGNHYDTELTINKNGKIEKSLISLNNVSYDLGIIDNKYGDGRLVFDDGKSQKLKETDILSLQTESSISNAELIKTIMESSQSFSHKTKYSQEKYIRKKLNKHHPIFIIHRCTSYYLCYMHYKKSPQKICYLRPDGMAQILYYASINYNSKVVLFETTQGLMAGAILERLTSDGILLQVYHSSKPIENILDKFKFSYKPTHVKYDLKNSIELNSNEYHKTFHCLILVSKYYPLPIVQYLLPLLMPSSPIIIFFDILQPLLDVYEYLKTTSKGFDLYITDTWFRNIKVQDDSTHPEVLMDCQGGYILRGIIINN
ncbi:hypothetical protein HZS_6690 [Henneguya salminicola]|nr:hypothetical protein HZS_6690 [Henneguya salminicola]